MATVQDQAASRLFKKLAALRVTLPNDERDVFDKIIPAEEEVTAHRITARRHNRRQVKSAEVTGHAMKKSATRAAKKSSVKAAKKAATK